MDPTPQRQLSDRDLLVEIHTTVRAHAVTTADHEQRLRRVERILWIGIGVAAAGGSAVGSFIGQYPLK